MTPEHAVAFFVFSVVAAGTPGPSNTMLTATGASVGVRRGLPALLGAVAGMGLLMFVVAYGLGSVILDHPLSLSVVKWGGAAFLGWLAWKIATASPTAGEAGSPVGCLGAALFQIINPKSWLVCASAAATFLDRAAGSPLGQSAALGLIFMLAALPSCLPWLVAGAALQRRLRSPRARRAFNIIMGLLLAASVILVIT